MLPQRLDFCMDCAEARKEKSSLRGEKFIPGCDGGIDGTEIGW